MDHVAPHAPVVTSPGASRRLRVEIHGAVQGVGFRPFVYRLATELKLSGWVINNAQGVFVEVEGSPAVLESFLARLQDEPPPRAQIHTLVPAWLAPVGLAGFEIRSSDSRGVKTALVLPDVATCDDCLREVLTAGDRRYRYPFANCTNCGPRFTIIEALPYDRPNTTMAGFGLCDACAAEYADPRNRRFHAQPTACPACGPHLTWWNDPALASDPGLAPAAQTTEPLDAAAAALRVGHIVAVKGLGGFMLLVSAGDEAAVARLRARKQRPAKPFALMARDLAQARSLCDVSPDAAALLTSPAAPIVLLPRQPAAPVAPSVAPDNPNLGIMLPYTPLHHLLLDAVDFPVVATSGNVNDEPICIDEEEAAERLGQIADQFLVHNRPITRHADDSVAWIIDGAPRLLRRARGYAPLPVGVRDDLPVILATGAHLKNTVALSVGRQVFISQHIGNLDTPQAQTAFERVIADFLHLFDVEPAIIAHDLHPDYASTRWAQRTAGRLNSTTKAPSDDSVVLVAVQHHHAHLASCLAEHNVPGPALGVTWDGTGYGTDGTIWGGEFLLGDAASFVRVAHLRPFRLPGGEAAIAEPARVALALLWDLFGPPSLDMTDLPAVQAFRPSERRVFGQMLHGCVNAPLTTSAGRLFDGIAALIGLPPRVSFEGQAAMMLEFSAAAGNCGAYPLAVTPDTSDLAGGSPHTAWVLDWRPLVEAVIDDLRRGVDRGMMAARFHQSLVEGIGTIARLVGQPQVVLTGGCFQNRRLTADTAAHLRRAGFEVMLHRQVPPNDGGISLGQVVVAAAHVAQPT